MTCIWRIAVGFLYAALSVWSVLLIIVIHQRLDVPKPSSTLSGASLSCSRVMHRIVLASDAIPHLYRNRDEGLGAAVAEIDPATCSDWPEPNEQRFVDSDYTGWVQAQIAAAIVDRPALQERPGWMTDLGLASAELESISPFAKLRSWIMAYPQASTGQGLRHYIRCDYALLSGPRHGFIMAALYAPADDPDLIPIDPALVQRIAECGLTERFEADMTATLGSSVLLPVTYQE